MTDWQALASMLEPAASAVRATPLAGGDINRAYRLDTAASRYFVKLNRAELEPMFVAERHGLQAIRASAAIRAPEVYLTGRLESEAFIVMEYIELGGHIDAERLARGLAAMHACSAAQFGFELDNTIGSSPQPNPLSDDWTAFWREHRLGFQLRLAERNGLDAGLLEGGRELAAGLERFFAGYRPRPSLLHGDLWSGNQGADAAGDPVIFDPACYYGDHETDLAMMELFSNPGARFFAVYAEHFAIDPGYAERRELYNLYHILNHANLFGGGYVASAKRSIERLLARLRA